MRRDLAGHDRGGGSISDLPNDAKVEGGNVLSIGEALWNVSALFFAGDFEEWRQFPDREPSVSVATYLCSRARVLLIHR